MHGMKYLGILCCLTICIISKPARSDDVAPPDRKTLEEQFAKTLTNARLSGFYTMGDSAKSPKTDQYTISKVEKSEGDKWIFTTKIAYGDRAFAMPLEIPVYWAGDTPVISVTDFKILGMGTFTARVMIYRDHYVGTWSHSGRGGGYMWGKIEPADSSTTKPADDESKK
jgi:hypothetical protein